MDHRTLPDCLAIPALITAPVMDLIEASSLADHLEWNTYPDNSMYFWVAGGLSVEVWSTGEQELWGYLASFCGYPIVLNHVLAYFAGNRLAPHLVAVLAVAMQLEPADTAPALIPTTRKAP